MKPYMLRKDVEEEEVLAEVAALLSNYGLTLRRGHGNISSIIKEGEKIGYVWYHPPHLRFDITLPEGLNVESIEAQLDERFKQRGFYELPKQRPPAPPIEVYTNGRKVLTNDPLNVSEIVKLLYFNHMRGKGD